MRDNEEALHFTKGASEHISHKTEMTSVVASKIKMIAQAKNIEEPGWFELDPCCWIFSRISPSYATFPCTPVTCAERILTATYSSVLEKNRLNQRRFQLKHGVPTVLSPAKLWNAAPMPVFSELCNGREEWP